MPPSPQDFTSYVDSSPFTALFERPARVKIFDVLTSKHRQQLSQGDIADLAGIDQSTVYRAMPKLVQSELVTEREEDDTTLYSFNTDHPAANGFLEAKHELTKFARKVVEPSDEDLPFDPTNADPSASSATEIRERVNQERVDL